MMVYRLQKDAGCHVWNPHHGSTSPSLYKHHTQETAAAMAGFSERTARRIERGVHQPSRNSPRPWRTRTDPFADAWDSELVPLLKHSLKLKAITLLGALLEHELAERAKRCIERYRTESRLDPGKTLKNFDFAFVPMVSKAHVMALAAGDAWLEKGTTLADQLFVRNRELS